MGKRRNNNASVAPESDSPLNIALEYSSLISQYIPWFNMLSSTEKDRFVKRTWNFRNSKTFHFEGMSANEEIPVLVSAAAVQLTFGLSSYRLDFFKHIYFMQDAYHFEGHRDLFIGHVSPDGIHLSWKHFLQGYADDTDNVNVAIHEMAHALEHNNFMDQAGMDWDFRTDFERLPPVYGPALASVLVHKRSYLRPYAFTSVQEFWAVSVEAFFENPGGLRDNMPGLYSVIGEILNQDPLTSSALGSAI